MIPRRFFFIFLWIGYAIIFAHSSIPHHHHEEEEMAQHEGSHNDDHNDIDHNFLGEAFSNFQHEKDNTIIYENVFFENLYSKVHFDKETLLIVLHIVQIIYSPPPDYSETGSDFFTPSSSTFISQLRGPPAVVA